MPAATKERDFHNNDDEHHVRSRGNDHSTNAIASATQVDHQELGRWQHNTEKSHQSNKQHATTTASYKRCQYHKRQSPPRRQQQQNRLRVGEEYGRQQQSEIGGVVEKQTNKQKNGGESVANEKINILQVDKVIKAARKRYGSVNDSSGNNIKGSSINLAGGGSIDIAADSNKEIGSKRNIGRQKKKFQPKHERQTNNGHRRKFQQGNDNRTPVKTHNDSENSSLPENYFDKVTDNIQLRNGKNTEGKNVAGSANPHENDGEESAINFDKNVRSPSTSTTRTEQELETQRRHGMKVQTWYNHNENEDCENVECDLGCVEMMSGHFLASDDDEKRKSDENESYTSVGEEEAESRGSDDSQQEFTEVNAVGMNGWHRFLELLHLPTDDIKLSTSAPDYKHIANHHTLNSMGDSDNKRCKGNDNNNDTALDQQTVTNMLGDPQHAPILSEEEALREEHVMLQREIESLEKDRLALESLFYKIEVEKRSHSRRLSD